MEGCVIESLETSIFHFRFDRISETCRRVGVTILALWRVATLTTLRADAAAARDRLATYAMLTLGDRFVVIDDANHTGFLFVCAFSCQQSVPMVI